MGQIHGLADGYLFGVGIPKIDERPLGNETSRDPGLALLGVLATSRRGDGCATIARAGAAGAGPRAAATMAGGSRRTAVGPTATSADNLPLADLFSSVEVVVVWVRNLDLLVKVPFPLGKHSWWRQRLGSRKGDGHARGDAVFVPPVRWAVIPLVMRTRSTIICVQARLTPQHGWSPARG